ncbi:MAG: cytidine deaminase [Bacteroidota bacterium]
MENNFNFTYETYADRSSLNEDRINAIQESERAREKAYAPYSQFSVGAALILDDGTVIHGNNQENKAYPSGLCAERTALFHFGAVHSDKKILRIAIAGAGDLVDPQRILSPCGSCRQVMAEYAERQNDPFEIIMQNQVGNILIVSSVTHLLPFSFGT